MPFDEDGRPTPETLGEVEHFFDGKRFTDETVEEFVRYITSLWRSGWIKQDGHIVVFRTGGWSANEALIRSMEKTPFWWMCWTRSERGGLHCFDLTLVPKSGGDAHDN